MVKLRTNWSKIISDYSVWLRLLKIEVFLYFLFRKKNLFAVHRLKWMLKLKCSETIITYRWQWPILNWLKVSSFHNKCLVTNICQIIQHFPLLNVKRYGRMDAIWWPFDTIKLDSPQFSPQAYRVVIADVEKNCIIRSWLVDRNRFDKQFTKNLFYFFYHSWESLEHLFLLITVQLVDSKVIHSFSEIVVIEFDTFLRKQNLWHKSIVRTVLVTRKKTLAKVCVIQSGSKKRS